MEWGGGFVRGALTSTVDIDARRSKVVDGTEEEEDNGAGLDPAGLLGLGHHAVLEFLQDACLTAFAAVTIGLLVGIVSNLLRREGNGGATHVAGWAILSEGTSTREVERGRGRTALRVLPLTEMGVGIGRGVGVGDEYQKLKRQAAES